VTSMMTQMDICLHREYIDTSDKNMSRMNEIQLQLQLQLQSIPVFTLQALQSSVFSCTVSTETVHGYQRIETFQHFRGFHIFILLLVEF